MENLEYHKRRGLLLEQLEENSVVLISGAEELVRNSDCHFDFRQKSNFYYLTGFEEPKAFLVLVKSRSDNKFILFNRENNDKEEMWQGKRAGLKGATELYGADEAYDISSLFDQVSEILQDKTHIYYCTGNDFQVDTLLPKWILSLKSKVRQGISVPAHFHDIDELISEMRLVKSGFEIDIMREVCQISAKAHKRAMQQAHKCDYEYQLQAEINHEFLSHGCHNVAYNSIVAAGGNACVLHYTKNNAPIDKKGLILIDAGAELNNYAADITRTFPVNGAFNKEQKQIYQIVLDAQKAGIEIIKPGVIWTEIQEVMIKVISQGLLSLGLLNGSLAEIIDKKLYQKFYMHSSGHWLGLDVHDQGSYKVDNQWRPLKQGMILTVEPGIYIASHHDDIELKWHDIGVRIEDDILVTTEGYENLTADVPREVAEIEALIRNAM